VPVVVPERYRRLDAAQMEALEKQAWEAIRSLDLNRLRRSGP
jgi:hypothetical protein